MNMIRRAFNRTQALLDEMTLKLTLDSDRARKRLRHSLVKRGLRPIGNQMDRSAHATVLSREPPVVKIAVGGDPPLWMLRAFGRGLGNRAATFLLVLYWTAESERAVAIYRSEAQRHRAEFPRHTLIFLCNTEAEQKLFNHAGELALFANQNMMVSEDTFRPIPGAETEFDAIYNAKLSAFKRHDLAEGIHSVAYITYVDSNDTPKRLARALCGRIAARAPGHRIINPVCNGLPVLVAPEEVNWTQNQASIGLCLSAEEGAMFASMEYMLAGLPIVSTPSKGGREVFFDPNFCFIVDAHPAAIKEGVKRLIAQNLSRHEVRDSTLAKVNAHRDRFRENLRDIAKQTGFAQHVSDDWLIGPPRTKKIKCHLRDIRA